MRVLLVVRPAQGGMRQHLLALASGLRREGVQVEAAGPAREPLLAELAGLGCPVLDIPLSASLNPFSDAWAAARLWSLMRRRRFDVVHVHGCKASLPGRVAAALAELPVVYTVHNFVQAAGGGPRRRLYLWFERALVPLTARYIAVSEALRQDLEAQARVPAARMTVVYNGVSAHEATPPAVLADLRREFELTGRERVVFCAARLVPEKGVDVLFRAVAALKEAGRAGDALPEFRVLVAGDGPEAGHLVALAAELGVGWRVALLGHRTDIGALLDLADAVVVPSRSEGLSVFLIEALTAGCPVVASNTGGLAELVTDGENGLLVPAGDPLALAAALRRLLADPALAARLSAAARLSGGRFTIDSMVRRTLRVYQEAASWRERKESHHAKV